MEKVRMNSEKTRRNKRLLPACGVLLAAGVCLFGCSRSVDIVEEGATTVRVIHSAGDVRWDACMEWVSERFMEQNPDIRVELHSAEEVEGQGYTDRLRALVAQDEFYDVVELREAERFAQAGVLAPLPKRIGSLVEDEKRQGADGARQDGSVLYSVPRYTTTLGVIYNKAIFDTYGLKEPETYEEFLGLCGQLKNVGIAPLAVGGDMLWHLNFWGNYLYENYIVDEDGTPEWSRERTEEMLRDFRLFSERGYILTKYRSVSDSQTAQELSSGSAAMLYSGPWMLTQITSLNPEMELGFFFLPGKDGDTWALRDDSVEWGISASCGEDEKRYEGAVRFLEFYYSEGIYEQVLADMNAVSVARREVRLTDRWEQLAVKNAYRPGVRENPYFVGDERTPDGFRTFYARTLWETLWGTVEIPELAAGLIERWEETDE